MDDARVGNRFAEKLWSRHANPGSVWTMVAAFPALILAIYRRHRPLFVGTLLAVALNPVLFSPPENDDAWATRVVLGERVWLERKALLSRETLFVAVCTPVSLFTLRAAARRQPIGTVVGTVASMILMLTFFGRMVDLYEEQSDSQTRHR